MDLRERVVLVTGAARRVGRAIAQRLAQEGCRIAIHYRASRGDADAVARSCGALGVECELFQADLADGAACTGLVSNVLARFGRLDVLINNASTFERMQLDDFDLARWEHTLRVNLTAPVVLVHAARQALRAARGSVVNLGDAAVHRPWPDHLAYMVSKGALETLTKVLARALAPDVNVVGVSPGVAIWPEDYDDALRDRLTARIPLKRAGTPADIAAGVAYLLRDGDYATGTILTIDGGRHVV